jgi:hypothetical protein
MSRINGEKARAAIAKSRRTAQRAKDRTRRAELQNAAIAEKTAEKPAAKTAKK